ncbi:hypothetical protein HDU92_000330, partial [Lobulomyces angularis]
NQGICFYLSDGHGEVSTIPVSLRMTRVWRGSKGENFMNLIKKVLPRVLIRIVYNSLKENLILLHIELDNELELVDEEGLCYENGCTLCLGLVLWGKIYFCNIGDSSMTMFNDMNDKPLKIWKKGGQSEYNHCSFEDTLANFPKSLREGQTMESVKLDFETLEKYLKKSLLPNLKVPSYRVVSNRSMYGLGMTNTIGNLNHKGSLVGENGLGRTTIYEFDDKLFEGNGDELLILFCSDGVKDVLDSTDFASLINNLEKGLISLAKKYSTEEIDEFEPMEDILKKISTNGSEFEKEKYMNEEIEKYDELNLDKFSLESLNLIMEMVLSNEEKKNWSSLKEICQVFVNLAVLKNSFDDLTCFLLKIKKCDLIFTAEDPSEFNFCDVSFVNGYLMEKSILKKKINFY